MSDFVPREEVVLRKGIKKAEEPLKKAILVEGNTVRVSELAFESQEVASFLMEKPTPEERRQGLSHLKSLHTHKLTIQNVLLRYKDLFVEKYRNQFFCTRTFNKIGGENVKE